MHLIKAYVKWLKDCVTRTCSAIFRAGMWVCPISKCIIMIELYMREGRRRIKKEETKNEIKVFKFAFLSFCMS